MECLGKFLTSDAGLSSLAVVTTSALPHVLPYLPNEVVACLNLSSIALSFGTHIWVGAIAGITMFKTLPRRTFGKVNSKLFPRYALLHTGTSLIAMYTWLHHNPMPVSAVLHDVEGRMLMVNIAANLVNSMWLINYTTNIMQQMYAREVELELPNEVGKHSELKTKGNDDDKKLLRSFGISHGVAMLMSWASLGACGAFLYQMSKRIAATYAIKQ